MAARPRVFTIPPSAPFLPTLAQALMDGRLVPGFAPGADPAELARATIYLPTRRACRLARQASAIAVDRGDRDAARIGEGRRYFVARFIERKSEDVEPAGNVRDGCRRKRGHRGHER